MEGHEFPCKTIADGKWTPIDCFPTMPIANGAFGFCLVAVYTWDKKLRAGRGIVTTPLLSLAREFTSVANFTVMLNRYRFKKALAVDGNYGNPEFFAASSLN